VSAPKVAAEWTFHHIGLLVTGVGEEKFLPRFLRSLMECGNCSVEVIRRIPQRSARTSPKRQLRMVNTGKTIPDSDVEQIGLPARLYLSKSGSRFVVLVDDLENSRQEDHAIHFTRYRTALDTMLVPWQGNQCQRASVHFLVNMVEAYYFADLRTVTEIMGSELSGHTGDVEEIRHPKNDLKALYPGFDEVEHGERIANQIDLPRVLSNPSTCASLRTLIKWCVLSMRQPPTERFQLLTGVTHPLTSGQIPGPAIAE